MKLLRYGQTGSERPRLLDLRAANQMKLGIEGLGVQRQTVVPYEFEKARFEVPASAEVIIRRGFRIVSDSTNSSDALRTSAFGPLVHAFVPGTTFRCNTRDSKGLT